MLASGGEWMRALLEVHCEELEWLWGQRLSAWRSAEYDTQALAQLDERIAAHTDALVLAGEEALPLVRECFEKAEAVPAALAAAYVMLKQEDGSGPLHALEAFLDMEGVAFEGFQLALRYAPPMRYEEALRRLAAGESELHAAAALSALAFHGKLGPNERLLELVRSGHPQVRCVGWETVVFLESAGTGKHGQGVLLRKLSGELQVAMQEPAPSVRHAAMHAAAWTRQPGLLKELRRAAVESSKDRQVLWLLAVLGDASDLPLFQSVGNDRSLGTERFALLGAFGHPALMEFLLRTMETGGASAAARAALAFRRMTGINVDTPQRVEIPEGGEETGADEDSLPEEVRIPDAELARSRWELLRKALPEATRLCHGVDMMKTSTPEWKQGLSLDVRWELALRSRFDAGQGEGPVDLERFPQVG
ncbi:hypothetical protein CYFUS_007040 [Cystobacter fuscus]|uniref:TIGR02270 family protein n=1 Tax=Cystobacter fuscus TaxID=43 RepID=A0A250JCD6_9BACT|nr:hypothetical protein [Cystobacter fuscus]ATB41574.1 hypothetical protein CYFUS_007040 [Cystobacter fuscus]